MRDGEKTLTVALKLIGSCGQSHILTHSTLISLTIAATYCSFDSSGTRCDIALLIITTFLILVMVAARSLTNLGGRFASSGFLAHSPLLRLLGSSQIFGIRIGVYYLRGHRGKRCATVDLEVD